MNWFDFFEQDILHLHPYMLCIDEILHNHPFISPFNEKVDIKPEKIPDICLKHNNCEHKL